MEQAAITNNNEETEILGYEFAKKLKEQDVVFLIGILGVGKTTFVKGMARGLGIESRIISPTFVIVRTHQIKNQNSKVERLYHLDLYRLVDQEQVAQIDIQEFFKDEKGVVVIEWPELGQNLVKKKVWSVKFEYVEKEKRKITIAYG